MDEKMTPKQFEQFRALLYDELGLFFSPEKKELVSSKIAKTMRKYQIDSFDRFYHMLVNGSDELWTDFTHEITTHKTDFFREIHHFHFIYNRMKWIKDTIPEITQSREIRVWSAGCSTGEEPYTLAIILTESLPVQITPFILATDISKEVLKRAMKGEYPITIKQEVPPQFFFKYFRKVGHHYEVDDALKKVIRFRQFNLMDPFPFKKRLDIIFCRNVMIYFDAQTQNALLKKFYQALAPGGLLFIGHSESLSNRDHNFRYLEPTIYQK